ncbi:MAG: WD40 repeat domain-containing protein [Anaerolineae bacterium]
MNRRFFLSLLILLGTVLSSALAPVAAQDDGLNLPTELYVLENDGVVTRYGIGAAGITDVTPADAFVLDFAVAPSDNHIAYRTEQGLSLKPLFSDDVLTIEAESASLPPIRGRGDTLTWTADASALAYTTLYGARVYFLNSQSFADISQANVVSLVWSPDSMYLAVEAQNPDPNAQSSFWWIYRRDNLTFTLVSAIPSSIGIAWQSSARIIFAPETGGLYAMDLSVGNAQTELFDASTVYRMPYVRDDSTVTAFANVPASEATAMPESSGITGRLVALVNGEPVETGAAPIDIDRVRWAPRGDLLIAFRGGALALVNPASGLAFSLPLTSAVAYGWGPLPPASVSGVDMPANGYFLSDFSTGVAQLWQLPADGSAAFPFTLMEDPLTEFAVSPDEQQVVFVSGGALWLQDIDPTAQPVSLATLENGVDVTPVFNASGDQIAYADNGIWLVSTAGGEATEVLDGDNNHPLFAPNVNALLVNNLDSGLGVLDLAAGCSTASPMRTPVSGSATGGLPRSVTARSASMT